MTLGDNHINSKDFLIGALVGGMIGATTAIFLAPKSGKELREGIQLQANEVIGKTGQITQQAKQKGNEIAEFAKQKSIEITEQPSQVVDKVKEWKDAAAELKRDIDNVKREMLENKEDQQKTE
jgi:gas vesicle protein